MIAAILATLIAQMSPEPSPSAAASSSPAASAAPSPSESPAFRGLPQTGGMVRRMPLRTPTVSNDDVVIRNSGSTNTGGYAIVVHPDDSVDVYQAGAADDHKMLAAPQAKWLFEKVKAQPLDTLVTGRCMKSASFGSYTTIAYDGHASGDLSCGGGDETTREINRTIAVIVQQLDIDTRPGRFRRLL